MAPTLDRVRSALGGEAAVRRVFGAVLTDNGHEFANEGGLAALQLGKRQNTSNSADHDSFG